MPVLPKYRNNFTNNAEKEIFNKAVKSEYFQNSKRFFIHSLRNQKANKKVVGEIDFVYLDDQFIIFLESKGGPVKYDSQKDEWMVLGGTKKGDPFAQVTSYLFYVRNTLFPQYFPKKRYHHKLIFGYGVMFPDIEIKKSFTKNTKKSVSFQHETIEYDPEIIYSSEDHEKINGLNKYIEHLKSYWRNHDKYSARKNSIGIGLKGLDDIRKIFRKDLIFEIPVSKVIESEAQNIDQFTEDQFTCLDTLDYFKNRGLIINGGPGTGKTVLALEILSRKILEKKKCAYFCYNKNLSGYISREVSKVKMGIDVYHIHGFLFEALKKKNLLPTQNIKDNDYWNKLLPQQFKLWFDSLDIDKYDFIVIDETQDIFQEELLDSIFLCLKDGIDSGNWVIFMDEVYQGFYKGFDKDYFKLFMQTYSPSFHALTINCRNHKDIIKMASEHTGLREMPCRREKVVFKTKVEAYENIDTLSKKLNELIAKLMADNIIPKQITVLTFNKEMISFIKSNSNHEIEEINEQKHYSNDKISISTIHGFKGLESDFVIIAGLEDVDIENNELMSLVFVGYSRAKMGLTILMNDYALNSLISRKN